MLLYKKLLTLEIFWEAEKVRNKDYKLDPESRKRTKEKYIDKFCLNLTLTESIVR